MKQIKAIVRSNLVDDILDALARIPDLPSVTLSHTLGWGSRAADVDTPVHFGRHILSPGTAFEILVPDELADGVIGAITEAARTGSPGDGAIVVTSHVDVIHIRTGHRATSEV